MDRADLVGWARSWGPYPFILMNLVLSLQAVYTGPLIMMAQNRDAERDRLLMHQDYETDRWVADEMRRIRELVEEQGRMLALLLAERGDGSHPAPKGRFG
jgi:uncharacterized membrane protein